MWVTRVRSRGNYYYYLATYCPDSARRERNVYALGKKEEATSTLDFWIKSKKAPLFLVDLGLQLPKVEKWLKKIS